MEHARKNMDLGKNADVRGVIDLLGEQLLP